MSPERKLATPRCKDLLPPEPERPDAVESVAGRKRGKAVEAVWFNAPERSVYMSLCEHGNAKTNEIGPKKLPRTIEGHVAWPSVARLASLTCLGRRTVSKALAALEAKGAIACLHRSKGGPKTPSVYMITGQLVPGCSIGKKAATGHLKAPNRAPGAQECTKERTKGGGPPSKPQNPAHHHPQKTEKTRHSVFPSLADVGDSNHATKTPSGFNGSAGDDDEKKAKRPSLEDPEEEFARRLRERYWLNGSVGDPSAIVVIVLAELQFSADRLRKFLAYEAPLTTSEKIKSPAAHYRSLVRQFKRAELQLGEYELAKRRPKRAEAPTAVCGLGICNGSGEAYDTNGRPMVCSCEAGMNMAPALKKAIRALGGAA